MNYGPKIVSAGLNYYLDAADRISYPGTGTLFKDLSGNNKNGTLTNGPTFTSSNGGGIVFDGANDYVDMGNAQTNTLYSITSITFSAWIYINSFLGTKCIMNSFTAIGGANFGPRLVVTSSAGTVFAKFGIKNAGGTFVDVTNANSLPFTTNINITGTYDGSNLRIYINGILQGTNAQSGNIFRNSAIFHTIGAPDADQSYWSGRIYSCAMYNGALSATQIRQNFDAQRGRFGI